MRERVADRYALDSNVYIHALRDRDAREELKAFLIRAGTRVVLSAVVAAELRAGAVTEAHETPMKALVGAYRSRGLVLTPAFEAYVEAGRVLAALQPRRRSASRRAATPLIADVLLATSCRESGVVLVTRNANDFSRIQRHLRGFRFVPPWPLLGRRAATRG